MAQTLERLTHRTNTMGSIRSIVRTMKTMSAINALPYEQAAQAMEAYRNTTLLGFRAFVQSHGPLSTQVDTKGPLTVIAFGSDHGLCGNYNEGIAAQVARTSAADDTEIVCVGAQMEDAMIGQGRMPLTTLLPPATADGLGRLAGKLIGVLDKRWAAQGAGPVSLVFVQRAPHGQQHAVTQDLLPLKATIMAQIADDPWTSRSLPQFSLPPDQLLAALIRSYLFAEIYRAAAEAMVTENAARLARMQQAERSVDEQLEVLTAEMRSVRQSEITTELLDVIIGFEALKGRDRRKAKDALINRQTDGIS